MYHRFILAGALLGTLSAAAQAQAPSYPANTITLIVPFAAGSGSDIGARILAKDLSAALQATVIVDNKPGANGALGAAAAARAKPDGYSMLVGSATTNAVNYAFFPGKLGYQPAAFQMVGGIGTSAVSLYVAHNARWADLADLLADAKAHPGNFKCGSGNAVTQVGCEIFPKAAGIDTYTVPYKSNPQSLADLAGGHIDFAFADASAAKALLDTKKIRPLAVASTQRHAHTPTIPTFRERGIPDLEMTAWTAVFVPAGTPKAIVETLHTALRKSNDSPESVQLHLSAGTQPLNMPLSEGQKFIDEEIARWARYVKASGVKPE